MQLPLFPLNSVLFPGMPIQLHIFEDRYKAMINECIDSQTPFGVVLIETGREAMGTLATPYKVGTTAHITKVERLPLGRMNITATGRERFRIDGMQSSPDHYLVGDVELAPFDNDTSEATTRQMVRLHMLVTRYMAALNKAESIHLDDIKLPVFPLPLAYFASVLLQIENSTKQLLLESTTTNEYLSDLVHMYRKEVVLMEILMSPPDFSMSDDYFSPN